MATDAALIYAACRNSTVGPNDDGARALEAGSVRVFDRAFRVCDELRAPFPMRDVHGIACFDNRLWVTCSFDNLIAICDLSTREWTRWYPAPNPFERDRDIHHFNTLRLIDKQVLVVAHCFGPSELLVYDYPSLQLSSAIPLGRMAHDIFSYKGSLATCSSADGCILNAHGDKLRTGNFPRGVATSASGNLLGMSMCSSREQRQGQDAMLRWYAPEWRFRADYVLRQAGMVLDVIEIDPTHYEWQAVQPWTAFELTIGKYNSVSPGNSYSPDSFFSDTASLTSEWHASEATHRWTAARKASLPVVINPGETKDARNHRERQSKRVFR